MGLSRSVAAAGLACLVAGFAVAACSGDSAQSSSGTVKDNLILAGPVKADSSAEKGGSCVWKPAVFNLSFTSGAMQGGAKVAFQVTVGVGGVGDESATEPALSGGMTPLSLVLTGKRLKATDGTVHVTSADLQTKAWKGTLEGTFEDGTTVSGSWSCQAVLG